jgi:hypothetical protein
MEWTGKVSSPIPLPCELHELWIRGSKWSGRVTAGQQSWILELDGGQNKLQLQLMCYVLVQVLFMDFGEEWSQSDDNE